MSNRIRVLFVKIKSNQIGSFVVYDKGVSKEQPPRDPRVKFIILYKNSTNISFYLKLVKITTDRVIKI